MRNTTWINNELPSNGTQWAQRNSMGSKNKETKGSKTAWLASKFHPIMLALNFTFTILEND